MANDVYRVVEENQGYEPNRTVGHYVSLAVADLVAKAGKRLDLNWVVEAIAVEEVDDYDEY